MVSTFIKVKPGGEHALHSIRNTRHLSQSKGIVQKPLSVLTVVKTCLE